MSDHDTAPLVVGPHQFRFTPPNRVSFIFRDTFDEDHAAAYIHFVHAQADRCGGVLEGIVDVRGLSRVTAGARSRVTKAHKAYPYRHIALVGASFSMRTVIDMVIKAGRVIAPSTFTFSYAFVSTLAEGEAWLEAMRGKTEGGHYEGGKAGL